MAPSTRSKTGNGPPAKRAAHDSSDEDSDDKNTQMTELKSKRRPAAKRLKLTGNDADAKTTPSRRSTARKTKPTTIRGGLKVLLHMPLDVLEEIFCALDPASLVNISRTTKSFRQLLLSPGYAHVWREAFLRDNTGIPEPPDGMQAKHWAMLLFGGGICEHCHQLNAPKVLFHLRTRLCEDCMELTLYRPSTLVFRSIPAQEMFPVEFIHKITSVSRTQYGYGRGSTFTMKWYTFADTYKTFVAGHKAALAKGSDVELSYLKGHRDTFASRYAHAEMSRNWQTALLAAQKQERERRQLALSEAKKARKQEIEKRLKKAGCNIRDKKVMSGVWKLKGINTAQPLTDEDWTELWPAICGVMDANRAVEDTKAAAKRREIRVQQVGVYYERTLHNIDCVRPHEVQYFPCDIHCLDFEPLKSFVEQDAPSTYGTGWDDATGLDTALRETIQTIREEQDTHRLSLYNMLVSGGYVGKETSQEKALSLAKAVFRLGSDRVHELRFGYEVLAEDRGHDYRRQFRFTYRRSPSIAVHDEGVAIVRKLQGLLGMDENSTVRDMDAANGNFVCMACNPQSKRLELKKSEAGQSTRYVATREVLSWRTAVEHIHWVHQRQSCADVDLRLLTMCEQAALEAKYDEKYKISHTAPISFGCCHCHEYCNDASKYAQNKCDGLMSKRDIIKHLQTKHSLPTKKIAEDVDFWYHPRFTRGLLDSSIKSFNLIEES